MRALLMMIVFSTSLVAQNQPIEIYLRGVKLDQVLDPAKTAAQKTTALADLLPDVRPNEFAGYVLASSRSMDFLDQVEPFRLNKLIGATTGGSGTSLVSKASVPAVIGFGVEYGSILQQSNGTVSTLRANLVGIGKLASRTTQFQYCPEIERGSCDAWARRLRRISGSVSFEDVREAQSATGTASIPNPTVVALFGNDFRMASWGLRFDLTPSNNLDDPKYVEAWHAQIDKLRSSPLSPALSLAVNNLFPPAALASFRNEAVGALSKATTPQELQSILQQELDIFIGRLRRTDPTFDEKARAAESAYAKYFMVRDELVRAAQTHKLSVEYTNYHPQSEPNRSNIRFIYSHQPTLSPTIVTLNLAASMYNSLSGNGSPGRLRDVQASGQMDSRIGEIPDVGPVTLTFAAYYQWMKEDALINIGPGNAVPGSGITLPGTAAALLGTKGHIGIAQAKLAFPLSGSLKIPLSLTWANRTELIKERDVRGQLGVSLDLDSLFR